MASMVLKFAGMTSSGFTAMLNCRSRNTTSPSRESESRTPEAKRFVSVLRGSNSGLPTSSRLMYSLICEAVDWTSSESLDN